MRHSGIPLSSLPRKIQEQVLAQDVKSAPAAGAELPATKIIRQSSGGLNKTEQAFYEFLRATYPEPAPILVQSMTLKLANGCRYTPDFVVGIGRVIDGQPYVRWVAYEVKGFMRDDAAVKIKVAAKEYQNMEFRLVKREGRCGQGWMQQRILP